MKFCIETHRDQNFVMKFEISKLFLNFLMRIQPPLSITLV